MHGGNLRWAREIYGNDKFIDLSANINPFGPPQEVYDTLKNSLSIIEHYPDPDCKELKQILSEEFQISMSNIKVGNGAGELLFTIVKTLNPKKVLIPVPAFSEYERSARSIGAEISYIKIGEKGWQSFKCSNDEFESIWRKNLIGCDLLFLCSPHNPTGSVIKWEYFKRLLKLSHEMNFKIIYDESFYDFLPDDLRWSARAELLNNPQLIIVYSLTKFYSIPGLRLGVMFAHDELIQELDQNRDPWSVNSLAQIAGIAALKAAYFPTEVRKSIWESKQYFYSEFKQRSFDKYELMPTSVNFAMIKINNDTSETLVNRLALKGILVRDCSNFYGLEHNFIRVAIKDIKCMEALLAALK